MIDAMPMFPMRALRALETEVTRNGAWPQCSVCLRRFDKAEPAHYMLVQPAPHLGEGSMLLFAACSQHVCDLGKE